MPFTYSVGIIFVASLLETKCVGSMGPLSTTTFVVHYYSTFQSQNIIQQHSLRKHSHHSHSNGYKNVHGLGVTIQQTIIFMPWGHFQRIQQQMCAPNNFVSLVLFILLFALFWDSTLSNGGQNEDVMSCVMCTIVVEAMLQGRTPSRALTLAYRRCGRMGLMEPVCDQMVERNAKKLIEMADNFSDLRAICATLQMCGQ